MLATATATAGIVFTGAPVEPAFAATITVNTTTYSQVDGFCSLPEAIDNANADSAVWSDCAAGAGDDVIQFALPGTGPFVIEMPFNTALPAVTSTIDIDGTSQPGFAGTPVLVIDADVDGQPPGFDLSASSGSAVRGFVVHGSVLGAGIVAGDASEITENWIGIDAAGMARPNVWGVLVDGASDVVIQNNVIAGNGNGVPLPDNGAAIRFTGTTTGNLVQGNVIGVAADGETPIANAKGIVVNGTATGLEIADNVISATTSGDPTVPAYAIGLFGDEVAGTIIRGNRIGTDASGTAAIPNDVGIALGNGPGSVVTGTVIGGTVPGQGNVVSGNDGEAISLWDTSSGTTIQGNRIGVGADGVTPLPNNTGTAGFPEAPDLPGQGGIVIRNSSSDNTIGGTAEGARNTIAHNGAFGGAGAGVAVFSGARNEIVGNSIFSNLGLGIDLASAPPAGVGPNPNDAGDFDAGLDDVAFPNNLQNAPVVSAGIVGSDLLVDFEIDSDPATAAYPIEIDVYEADWTGQGDRYLGSQSISSPGSLFLVVPEAVGGGGISTGDLVVATARDANGNTSEFSDPSVVTGPRTFVVNDLGDDGDVFVDGFCEANAEFGDCTLRAAIEEANGTPQPDTIVFDFPGTAPVVFAPQSDLPDVVAPLTIDGLSTPNATCATWPPALRVVIDASDVDFSGLLATDRLALRGVVLNGTPPGNLVYLESTSTGSSFECNFFGTDVTGTQTVGSSQTQIWFNGASGNSVGGELQSQRNLFAGNTFEHLWMPVSDDNTVDGNYFGTDVAGEVGLGVANGPAIFVGGRGNRIGGVTEGTRGNLIAHRVSSEPAIEVYDSGNGAIGNEIRGNSIHSNNGLGLDLTRLGDVPLNGVTFNHVGPLATTGANDFQNYPVITTATTDGDAARVVGTLDSLPNRTYAIDVYANGECDATSFGEGETHLGSFEVTTDATGQVSFDSGDEGVLDGGGVAEPDAITATATDLTTGSTSEFSYCRPVSTINVNWVQAQATASGVPVSQYITNPLQEKWFRVPAGPGADVSVRLEAQPGYALSLHSDPLEAYNAAANPQSAVALAAEAADVAFLPSGSLPSGSLPSGSLPSGSLPSGSLPSGSLEIGFLPSGSLPSGSLPSGSLPSGSLPSGSLPSGSLPSGSLPSGSLPSGSLPSGSLPSGSLPSGSLPSGSLPSGSLPSGSLPSGSLEAYGTASVRSLVAWSANPYSSVQTIQRNTFDRSGDVYVRVVGPFDLDDPFDLTVTVSGGVCSALAPVPQVDYATPADSGRNTVILTDSGRMTGTPAQVSEAIADLTRFAARADVNGVVVDLADPIYADVAAANVQADALPNCAFAKNVVADEIKDLVDEFRLENPIEYVVIAGGADVVPFHQVSDVAGLANEREYVAPAAANSPTEAGLRSGLVKGQDFYGSTTELTVAGRTLALPDLAVGRLVDSAADISIAIEAYEATDGVVVPSSSLVTGYDFVGDAAATIAADLTDGLGTTPTTLIQAPGEFPSAPTAWTADQLRTPLLTGDNDVVMLTGHFSAGKLLAADYRTTLLAAEVQDGAADFSDVIVLALGCHGGFSLPSTDLVAGASPDPDWAKAFLRQGAASFVAATGYAYGDTELEEYGERLFVELTRQMRTGSGPIAMGEALVAAKQAYLAQVPQLGGIDEKTIVEMTLYGLPMMKVDVPGDRLPVPTSETSVDATTPVGGTATPGLSTATIEVRPTFGATEVVVLDDLDNGGTVTTQYTVGDDGVVAIPFEPVLPKQLDDVSRPGNVLRGVALRGGTYTDVGGVVPFTSAPTTETSRPIQSFQTDVFYPNQVWMPNFFAAIDGGPTRLVTVPQQYRSSGVGSVSGTLRSWTEVAYQLYYLPDTWNTGDPSLIEAGVGAAPSITGASASVDGDTVTFSVNAVAEGAAGVQAVWILYTGEPGSASYGRWLPVDLVQDDLDPTVWTGTLALGGAPADPLRFMVQAVGGAGLATLSTNLGAYFRVGVDNTPEVGATPTSTVLVGPPSGEFGAPQTFEAYVTEGFQPVVGGVVDFEIAGQRAQAVTGSSGVASITITPFADPGTYEVQATLRGSSSRPASSDVSTFTIAPATTTLILGPSSSTSSTIGSSGLVASLTSADGGLGGKPIVFTIDDGATTTQRVIITDAWGDAELGDTGLPPGSYTVTAAFGGAGGVAVVAPAFAGSTSGAATLVLEDRAAPTITASATVTGGAPYVADTWTTLDVTVAFTCADTGGGGIASCAPPQTVTTPGITPAVTGVAVDAAGLTTSASFGPVKIDRSGPAITVTTPAAGASYPVGSSVLAGFSCVDTQSGVATCAGTVATGAPVSTATPGARTFVVTATDALGNVSTTTVAYTVVAAGNAAPTVTADMGIAGLQEIGFRSNAVLITGSSTDPDGRAPYRAWARWTTGGVFTPFAVAADGRFAAAWIYGSSGTRTVTIRVCDAQGQCGTDDITVRSGVSQRVVPVRQCVTDRGARTNPRYRATFGYDNPAPFAIATLTVPLIDNAFIPLPAFRGQPQIFLPGSHRNVFTADFHSGTLNWTLHGTTVTARSNSPRC